MVTPPTIFESGRQSQQARFNAFYDSVRQVVSLENPWVVYYAKPADPKTIRLEIRQDLLNDWSATRYTTARSTRKVSAELVESCKVVFKWALALEAQGMLKTVESLRAENGVIPAARFSTYDEIPTPAWVYGLIEEFTQHNDWVDLATCLSMSVDEYVDANWRRFLFQLSAFRLESIGLAKSRGFTWERSR